MASNTNSQKDVDKSKDSSSVSGAEEALKKLNMRNLKDLLASPESVSPQTPFNKATIFLGMDPIFHIGLDPEVCI